MASDLVVMAMIAAFFAACVLYVRRCDHIVSPDVDLGRRRPRAELALDDVAP